MKKRKWFVTACVVVLIAVFAAGCSSASQQTGQSPKQLERNAPSDKKEPVAITIGVPVVALSSAIFPIAEAAGYFEEEGLNAEFATIPAGSSKAALLNREVEAIAFDTSTIFDMADTRQALMIQQVTNSITLDVVVSKEYAEKKGVSPESPLEDRIKALQGAKMATLSLGGLPHRVMSYLLSSVGLDHERDFEVVALQNPPAALAALAQGEIDGFALSAPNSIQAEMQGTGIVLISHADVPSFRDVPTTGLVVLREFAESNPEEVRRIVRALGKAHELLANDQEASVRYLSTYFPNLDPELLRRSLVSMQSVWGNRGRMTEEGMQESIRFFAESGFIDGDVEIEEGVHWTNKFNE